METFRINVLLTIEENDSEYDDVSKVKSEMMSWLEDLGFAVEFKKIIHIQEERL